MGGSFNPSEFQGFKPFTNPSEIQVPHSQPFFTYTKPFRIPGLGLWSHHWDTPGCCVVASPDPSMLCHRKSKFVVDYFLFVAVCSLFVVVFSLFCRFLAKQKKTVANRKKTVANREKQWQTEKKTVTNRKKQWQTEKKQ